MTRDLDHCEESRLGNSFAAGSVGAGYLDIDAWDLREARSNDSETGMNGNITGTKTGLPRDASARLDCQLLKVR